MHHITSKMPIEFFNLFTINLRVNYKTKFDKVYIIDL